MDKFSLDAFELHLSHIGNSPSKKDRHKYVLYLASLDKRTYVCYEHMLIIKIRDKIGTTRKEKKDKM